MSANKYEKGDRVYLMSAEEIRTLPANWQRPRTGTIVRGPGKEDSGLRLYRVKVDNTRPGYGTTYKMEEELTKI